MLNIFTPSKCANANIFQCAPRTEYQENQRYYKGFGQFLVVFSSFPARTARRISRSKVFKGFQIWDVFFHFPARSAHRISRKCKVLIRVLGKSGMHVSNFPARSVRRILRNARLYKGLGQIQVVFLFKLPAARRAPNIKKTQG